MENTELLLVVSSHHQRHHVTHMVHYFSSFSLEDYIAANVY